MGGWDMSMSTSDSVIIIAGGLPLKPSPHLQAIELNYSGLPGKFKMLNRGVSILDISYFNDLMPAVQK